MLNDLRPWLYDMACLMAVVVAGTGMLVVALELATMIDPLP